MQGVGAVSNGEDVHGATSGMESLRGPWGGPQVSPAVPGLPEEPLVWEGPPHTGCGGFPTESSGSIDIPQLEEGAAEGQGRHSGTLGPRVSSRVPFEEAAAAVQVPAAP